MFRFQCSVVYSEGMNESISWVWHQSRAVWHHHHKFTHTASLTAPRCTAHCNTMHCAVRPCTALHHNALHRITMYCTAPQSNALHSNTLRTAPQCTAPYHHVLYCTTEHYTEIHCTLHHSALHCTALHDISVLCMHQTLTRTSFLPLKYWHYTNWKSEEQSTLSAAWALPFSCAHFTCHWGLARVV